MTNHKSFSRAYLLSAIACVGLLAACNNAADEEDEAGEPEATEVALADACPERVTDQRGATEPLTCSCTPEAAADGNVWGAGPYTDDSNVCRAAMHAGLIGDEPVNVTINFMAGRSAYTGSVANGVTSRRYGNWGGSFAFEGATMGEPSDIAAKDALEPCPASAGALRGSGRTIECSCTAEAASSGSVWGSSPYTDDSRVCRAAVHAGVIADIGGEVHFTVTEGQESYAGSTQNGVRSSDYGRWAGSFEFEDFLNQ